MTFSCWKTRNHSEPNLENTLNEAMGLRSPVRPTWPWWRPRSELACCHGGAFSSPNVIIFLPMRCWTSPIIWRSRVLTSFCPSQGNRRDFLLRSRFSGYSLLFRLFFRLCCVPVYSCFKTPQELHFKYNSEVVSRTPLFSEVSKSGTDRTDGFLMPKIPCRYDHRGLLRYPLFQLSRAVLVGILPKRGREFFPHYWTL